MAIESVAHALRNAERTPEMNLSHKGEVAAGLFLPARMNNAFCEKSHPSRMSTWVVQYRQMHNSQKNDSWQNCRIALKSF